MNFRENISTEEIYFARDKNHPTSCLLLADNENCFHVAKERLYNELSFV